jgi:pyruvate formate lyase activating enzyme
MKIGGLQKLTLIDYPGRLAATVFLSFCDFRCPFCYSSELVLPEKVKDHPKISKKSFFDFLKDRKGLLEAVVICGGEPTLNKELPSFAKKIKNLGYMVKLDTNGSDSETLKKLISKKLIDYVAMDIKASKDKYKKAVGLGKKWNKNLMKNIEESIGVLKNSEIDYEFRTTVVPGIHEKEDILKIAHWIKPASKYYLQNFRPEKTLNPDFEKIKPYPQTYLLEIQKAISPFFEVCQVR